MMRGTYHGPLQGVSLVDAEGVERDYLLVPGATVELPEGETTNRLVAVGQLVLTTPATAKPKKEKA